MHIDTARFPAATSKVWISNETIDCGRNIPCAYIEPCGMAHDGFFFPADLVEVLLETGVIVPHHYEEPERYVDGIGFDVPERGDGWDILMSLYRRWGWGGVK